MLVDRPAEHHALSAVLIVRLQDQLLAVSDDEITQVDDLAPIGGVALADLPGPRDVLRNRRPLRRRVQGGVAVIGEQGEAHLLVKEFGAEAVDDRHRSVEIRADECLRDVTFREELAREHAPIDQVDDLPLGTERPSRVGQVLRRADDGRDPARLEVPLEHLELRERRETAPIDDRDRRRTLGSRAMRPHHGRELPAARRNDVALELLAELLHDWERGEDLRELVVVGHAGG